MTLADITLAMFTLCNSLRVLAYGPQIAKAAADRGGVEAISFMTWGLFLLSNISAVAYALVNMADWTMATMFLGNAAGCAIILLVGAWKRLQHRNRFLEKSTKANSDPIDAPAGALSVSWFETPRTRLRYSGRSEAAAPRHEAGRPPSIPDLNAQEPERDLGLAILDAATSAGTNTRSHYPLV
jgi:hypothetical protein